MTIKMTRDASEYAAPHTADVHPDEVANYAAAGWQEADEVPSEPMTADAIPADWDARHWKQKVKLASEIAGRDVTNAEAGEIIAEAYAAQEAAKA